MNTLLIPVRLLVGQVVGLSVGKSFIISFHSYTSTTSIGEALLVLNKFETPLTSFLMLIILYVDLFFASDGDLVCQ